MIISEGRIRINLVKGRLRKVREFQPGRIAYGNVHGVRDHISFYEAESRSVWLKLR